MAQGYIARAREGGMVPAIIIAFLLGVSLQTSMVATDLCYTSPQKATLPTTSVRHDISNDTKVEETKTEAKVVRPDGYDMIDIGSSKGAGSINFLHDVLSLLNHPQKQALIDPRELGLDIDPNKVTTCQEAQKNTLNDCKEANILTLTPEELGSYSSREVRGNSFWHVLEHIPDCKLAEDMWVKAAALSSSFSSFHGPAFDNELSASGQVPTGYHRFWENWHGHTCHFNSTMMESAIRTTKKATAYVIVNIDRIESTDHSLILPEGSPEDSHHYDPNIHPPKDSVSLLDKELYQEMRACSIYDSIKTNEVIGLFSALCLWDALSVPVQKGTGAFARTKVVSCKFGETERSTAECVQLLTRKVTGAIQNFYQTDEDKILDIL